MSLKDFKLIGSGNEDIQLNDQNDWSTVEGDEEIAQTLSNILKTGLGEWFLNTSLGTDWFSVLGKGATEEDIELVIVEALFKDTRVISVDQVIQTFNNTTRKLEVVAEVTVELLDDNDTIRVEVTV